MTYKEAVIISAYTGFLMCDFDDMHKYICGFILDEDVGIVTYHDLDKSGIVEMAHTEVYPRLCPNCKMIFKSIRLPKDVRRKYEPYPEVRLQKL